MTNQEYPYNLIRAIYGDHDADDTHVSHTDIPNLYRTLDLLPDIERTALLMRYQDYATLKETGRSIDESSSSTSQIIRKALKRLRRFGDDHYFDIHPITRKPSDHSEIDAHICELQLSSGAETCLISAGYHKISQLRPLPEAKIKSVHNFGETHYREYQEKLAIYEQKHGLSAIPKPQYPANLILAIYEDTKNPESYIETTDIQGLELAINTLSKQEQLFVFMKYKDEQSAQEIGEQTHLSTNRVAQTIRRGVLKMKHMSRKRYFEKGLDGDTQLTPKERTVSPKTELTNFYPYNLLSQIMDKNENVQSIYVPELFKHIESLPENFKTYIKLRYEFGLTRLNCGKRMSKTNYEVEQLEIQVHRKLRNLKNDGALSANPSSQLTKKVEENHMLRQENQALKNLIKSIVNGTIKPEDIMVKESNHQSNKNSSVLATPIEQLDMSSRAHKILSIHRWDTLGDIAGHTRKEFKALRRVGVGIEQEIDTMLMRYGLSFKGESNNEDTTSERHHLTPLDVRDAERGLRDTPLTIEMMKHQ